MRLVDARRIIAALAKDSAGRKIFFSDEIDFLTTEVINHEILEHREELLMKTRLIEDQLNITLSLLV